MKYLKIGHETRKSNPDNIWTSFLLRPCHHHVTPISKQAHIFPLKNKKLTRPKIQMEPKEVKKMDQHQFIYFSWKLCAYMHANCKVRK